jgi:autotransporter translocation and assembly factor TamB
VARFRRLRAVSIWLAKALVGIVVLLLVLAGLAIGTVETGWAKNRIRDLLVRQANQYLTATLTIGRLEGSLFGGLQLGDISLSRGTHTLIHIDEIALTYSIRELVDRGTIVRRVRLTRPYVVGSKLPDGRWDLGALVKRESREQERTGPNRPIQVQSIEVVDGHVSLQDPLDFGAAHVPTDFQHLNASFAFSYVPVRWSLDFADVSWVGHAPDLSVDHLSGRFGRGPGGLFFERFSVRTARSDFTLDGTIAPGVAGTPTVLDLAVHAPRFAFQEWSGVLHGLQNIAVQASFDTALKGPTTAIATDIRLKGTGGGVKGTVTLDTSVPGWHGAGAVDVDRLNLARWLNRDDRPSDITGAVTFDLALELGRRFPQGRYTFEGPHAMYMNYEADRLRARGEITSSAVVIAEAAGLAYGAGVTARNGSIGIDAPFPYRFEGTITKIDLRNLPKAVPVPHVESLLTFDYDVSGRFDEPFIVGRARFAASQFLGASVGAGAVGSIDTLQQPLRYTGDGEVDGLSMRRFGDGLDVAWMRDPRYAGTISGHFFVDGVGSGPDLRLAGGGRVTRADLFKGRLLDGAVSAAIDGGSLRASYDGRLAAIDPSIPFADPRFDASLTGTGTVNATVRDLLTRTTTLADYDVDGTLTAERSTVRGVAIDRGRVEASLHDSTLSIARVEAAGPALEGRGNGTVALVEGAESDFAFDITRMDLAQLRDVHAHDLRGTISTKGRLTGPSTALRIVGEAFANNVEAADVSALTATGTYDATVPAEEASRATVRVEGHAEFLTALGQSLREASGTITYDADRLGFDLKLVESHGRNGQLAGAVLLHADRREAVLQELTVALGSAPWKLQPTGGEKLLSWTDDGFSVTPIEFADPNNDERIGISGTWRRDGTGALHVTATHVFLDTLQTAFERPTRYGGTLDLDATIRGTREEPQISGTLTVTNGRVERFAYQRLAARFQSSGQMVDIDARLDQAPGVWLTANGKVPLSLFDANLPEQPLDVTIKSSTISLGLIEGVTDVVHDVSGQIQLDLKAIGTSRDPHMAGAVQIANAGFVATATGARYKNIRGQIGLARDKIAVETLHIEDVDGHPLELHGSLGTHELQVSDLEIEATARRFEVLRNELGRINVDATLQLRGRFETPRIAGDLTISSGTLRVDEILARTVFQPYATTEVPIAGVDALAALNPWDRLGLDVSLHVPGSLRLQGDNVQVSPGTPIGLGDINLRVSGDLYLYKDSAAPLSVTGSFDSVTGTYAFQGRRFDVLSTSSINFHGELNPELYVTVTRVIQGVETRVSIFGTLREPELRLASTPPLDQSDILSLIVFNTSTNQLTGAQQQQLLIRAGALAAGFLATPVVSAIESHIGLNMLEVEPGADVSGAPKLTVGQEIAPGLVARFSRQFGQEPYDEATVEYLLSRIFRLRATFSDAQTLSMRSPFRRVERAGIDLLVFFSF